MNETIKEIIKKDARDIASCSALLRLMFLRYPAIEVYNMVEEALAEASDEQWFENKYPEHIFMEKFGPIKKEEKRFYKTNDKLKDLVNTKIKISDIAKKYGLSLGKNKKYLCPFHNDSNPSLSLNDKKNVFYCFGCQTKGDIFTFIKKLEELKNGQ